MAIIYGKNTAVDYAAGNLASFGKSYSRMGAAPLDMYEVWYNYEELVKYASFRGTDANGKPVYDGNTEVVDTSAVTSYVGQKVAYVDDANGKIYHYSIELDGSLKEIGTSPIGDNKSIVVAADGTVSLKGVDALVFERDILDEEGNPTGNKENVQFQPLMTKDGLIWVEPSKTTVEGLAALIDGLTARVSALENDRVTEQELADAVKAEADRAKDAEKALEEAIQAIDFVDNDELEAAVKIEADRAKEAEKALGERIDAIDYIDADELATELVPYAKTADVNTALAEKAKQTDLEALQGRVDAFLTGTGATEALDSLQELIKYINEHDDVELADIIEDIQAINDKLVGVDGTVTEYVAGAIAALNIGDYAKATDLTELAGRVKTLEDEDNFTQAEFVEFETANTQAIVTAKQEAIDAAALAVTNANYATKAELEAHEEAAEAAYATKVELAAHEEAAAAAYATKAELEAHDEAADGKYATKTELNAHAETAGNTYATKEYVGNFTTGEDAYKDITSIVGYINKKAEETLSAAQGGSSETAASVALALQNYKNENDPKVQKNANDIVALAGQLGTTNTNVTANTEAIAAINTNIGTNVTPKIEALIAADVEIEKTLGEHTNNIAALVQEDARLAGLIGGNTTNINTLLGKVNIGDTTVTEYVAAEIGKIKPYDDTAVKALITAEETRAKGEEARIEGLITAEVARADAEEKRIAALVGENATAIAGLDATLKGALENDGEGLDSIKELALWIENHKTEVIPVVNKNKEDIAALTNRVAANETAVGTTLPAAIAQALVDAKAYTDEKMVKADGISIVNNEGTFSVGAISTDNLVQGQFTLILNGGDAEVSV